MSHLDILLPFGLPPAELSADLFRELHLPALATLTARARAEARDPRHETFEDFHRSLPHEIWLARQFAFGDPISANTSPPIANALMHAFGLNPDAGVWFAVQPVHIHIAHDHLVLTDPRQLDLAEQDARTLFEQAQSLFDEAGKSLVYGNPGMWFVRADEWDGLQTATPDAATGHNIDIWMPKGTGERDWRKIQNEVQMHWFNHPVNEAREASGRKPVNSIWLWGGSTAQNAPTDANGRAPYAAAFNLRDWMAAFAQFVPRRSIADNPSELLAAEAAGRKLLVLDAVLQPALATDWAVWLEHMRTLESTWFAPILEALKSGRLDQVSVILTHDSRISSFTATRSSLRKFWVKPTLASLCP